MTEELSNDALALELIPSPHVAYNVYSNDDRMQAATLYVIHGNVQTIAELTGLPVRTLYGWLKADWWPRFLDQARREHQELIESRLSDILVKATYALTDRIEHGDVVINRKGEQIRVPLKAKDLNQIIKDSVDKLRLLRNQPSRVTAEVKFDVSKIERNFAEVAEKFRDSVVAEQ